MIFKLSSDKIVRREEIAKLGLQIPNSSPSEIVLLLSVLHMWISLENIINVLELYKLHQVPSQ